MWKNLLILVLLASSLFLTNTFVYGATEPIFSWDKNSYTIGSSAVLTLEKDSANQDPNRIEFTYVTITSSSDRSGIEILFVETGNNTGIFKGEFVVGVSINVSSGDTLYAKHEDTEGAALVKSTDTSTTQAIPSILAPRVFSLKVDGLATWGNYATNAVQEAVDFWEKQDNVKFTISPIETGNIYIKWVKNYGGQHLGLQHQQLVEVSLGDDFCGDKWNPYDPQYVRFIMIHEIGHALGYSHETQSDSYMSNAPSRLYAKIEHTSALPAYWSWFIPSCSQSTSSSMFVNVESSDNTKFDVYFLPSDEYQKLRNGQQFNTYSQGDCVAYGVSGFSGTCNVGFGSGLAISGAESSTNINVEFIDQTNLSENFKIYATKKFDITQKIPKIPIVKEPIITKIWPAQVTLSFLVDGKNYGSVATIDEGEFIQFTGKVTDRYANPLSGIRVFVNDKDDINEFQKSNTTDNDGAFTINWAPKHNPNALGTEKSTWDFIAKIAGKYDFAVSEEIKISIRIPESLQFKGDKITCPAGAILVGSFCVSQPEYKQESDQAEKEKGVPEWIKNTAKWWSEDLIEDSDFTSGIQHLIKESIINIPDLPEQTTEKVEEQVPDWVRNNAGWWADGLISEDDFLNGIKYLVEQGIIKV